ncbi:MAG: carboxylesterase family protein [Candidatus Theseobacter exili]|nr:carboxylesterase family protein [Candidatus Theseobacter exili]
MNKNNSFLQEIKIPENITIVRNLSYRNTPDTTCKLDVYFMDKKGPVSSPAIVFIHGGSWQEGDKSNPLYIENCIKYANKGYICVTVNYRVT